MGIIVAGDSQGGTLVHIKHPMTQLGKPDLACRSHIAGIKIKSPIIRIFISTTGPDPQFINFQFIIGHMNPAVIMGYLERFRLDVSLKRHRGTGLGARYDIPGVCDIAGYGRVAGSVKGQRISSRDALAAHQVPEIRVAVGNILRIDIQAALRNYRLSCSDRMSPHRNRTPW